MGQGMLHRLIAVLIGVSSDRNVRCDCADLEKIAILVHRVMSRQSRQFHTLEHVFGFLDGADPETTLAAIFHDLVYYQVDEGLPPELDQLIGSRVRLVGGKLYLAEEGPTMDSATRLCLGIFGFEAGQPIAVFGGLNEYLSALAMMKLLGTHMNSATLVAIAACIEASIPFRGVNAAGNSAIDQLAERLERLASAGLFDVPSEGIAGMLHRAVAFGNHDVRDFALDDPAEFLTNTWKLLPESNAALRRRGAFSIHEYRVALEKMLAFFQSLDPAAVYHAWGGIPNDEAMSLLTHKTRRNLAWASTYMNAKLLAAGLLEAVAQLSGGDAPMALFMGDVECEAGTPGTLPELLTHVGPPAWLDPGNPVYHLLRDGRLDESSFDLKNSPLALFLYERLEPGAWGRAVRAVHEYFAGRLDAKEFFMGLPRDPIAEILDACIAIVPTRAAVLARLRSSATEAGKG